MSKEDKQWEIMHVLRDGNTGKCCSEKCGDPICDYGCLNLPAQNNFRAHIMHAIQSERDNGSNRFPLNVGAYLDPNQVCPGGTMGQIGSNKKICRDPVCRVTGCLYKPAWHYRELIKLDIDYQLIKALKK